MFCDIPVKLLWLTALDLIPIFPPGHVELFCSLFTRPMDRRRSIPAAATCCSMHGCFWTCSRTYSRIPHPTAVYSTDHTIPHHRIPSLSTSEGTSASPFMLASGNRILLENIAVDIYNRCVSVSPVFCRRLYHQPSTCTCVR
jgi:hypothetical protein